MTKASSFEFLSGWSRAVVIHPFTDNQISRALVQFRRMDIFALYVSFNEALLRSTGMTHPMAHVNAGLAIYLGVQVMLRTRRASAIALHAVIGAELMNEILERAHYGSWRWPDTLADIATTLFWPSALFILAAYRRKRWHGWQGRLERRAHGLSKAPPEPIGVAQHADGPAVPGRT